MAKIALSGASGHVGSVLRRELPRHGIDLRSSVGLTPAVPLHAGEDLTHGDLRDPAVVDALLHGVEVLIHMAGTSVERPLQEIIDNNLIALHAVYEGARRNGVRRVVFASSNHAFGMHGSDQRLRQDAEFRPDSLYGLSKVWGEAMARMYWDKHGIEGICLRIGTTKDCPPEDFRQLSTWMGTDDLVALALRCIQAPVDFTVVWGISDNDRAYYDLSEGNRIGFAPQQNAEHWAQQILAQPNRMNPVARGYQGGEFVTLDFTPPEARPPRRAVIG